MKKVVVITGGASGIGLSTAELLTKNSYQVVVLDIIECPKLYALGIDHIQCDLNDAAQIKTAFKQIATEYSTIHGLINAAGILLYGNATDLAISDWDRVLNINLKAPFLCAKYAIPLMIKGSLILNIASVQSFYAQPQVCAYATSKAALLGLTKSIAIDYAGEIRCIAVCPGTIDTPMLQNALNQADNSENMMRELNKTHLTQRIGKADEIAELLLFLCSEKCQFITGTEIRVDGGLGINLGGSIDS